MTAVPDSAEAESQVTAESIRRNRPLGAEGWGVSRMSPADESQGQRSLKRCSRKNFQQEAFAPAATAAFPGDALAAGMLLQQR
jgi:hypothetical protein